VQDVSKDLTNLFSCQEPAHFVPAARLGVLFHKTSVRTFGADAVRNGREEDRFAFSRLSRRVFLGVPTDDFAKVQIPVMGKACPLVMGVINDING
jgi:hypothetical protein